MLGHQGACDPLPGGNIGSTLTLSRDCVDRVQAALALTLRPGEQGHEARSADSAVLGLMVRRVDPVADVLSSRTTPFAEAGANRRKQDQQPSATEPGNDLRVVKVGHTASPCDSLIHRRRPAKFCASGTTWV